MVNVNDCGCPCEDSGKKKQIEERALSSINKIYTTEGATYFPDGTGMVTLPIPTAEQIQQIGENSERLTIDEETLRQLKISDAENVEAIAQAQRDISAHAEEIGDIKATDAQQNTKIKTAEGEIDALKTLTDSITKSLITDVEVRDGAGSGTFLVELTEEDGTKRTSDTYQYGQVGSFELIQGTEAGYIRGRLTLTNGVVKESNDFQILQLVESDVYVTAITLTPDYTAGKLGGEIGYSNGNKAQIDPVLVPTAPGVTSNIDALLKRMTSAETVDKEQTAKIANLETRVKAIEDTPGVGQFAAGKLGTIKGGTADGSVQAQEDGTGTVVGWSGKASVASVTALQNATKVAVSEFAITESADKITITTTAIDGATSKSEDIPAVTDTMAGIVTPALKKKWDGGDGWIEIDFNSWPTDWAEGDVIKVIPSRYMRIEPSGTWTSTLEDPELFDSQIKGPALEFELNDAGYPNVPYNIIVWTNAIIITSFSLFGTRSLNDSEIGYIYGTAFNGSYMTQTQLTIKTAEASSYFHKIYRKAH